MTARRDQEFEVWARANYGTLLRTATALTAGDVHYAEDLVQSSLVRLYVAWPRATQTKVVAYARKMVVNALIDDKRRPLTRCEEIRAEVPETPAAAVGSPDIDERILEALVELPVGMRSVVVLRHVEGLTVEETADAMGATAATVRSQTSRGLDKLRLSLGIVPVSSAAEKD